VCVLCVVVYGLCLIQIKMMIASSEESRQSVLSTWP